MKKQWQWLRQPLNGILMFALTLSVPALAAPERLLLTTQHWPPYQLDNNGQIDGIAVKRLQCTLRRMKQPYQISFLDWSEAQLQVKQGTQHGFFSASRNQSRDSFAQWVGPIAQQTWVWYSLDDNLTELYHSMDFKERVTVAATFGSGKWFWLKRNGYRVVKDPKEPAALLDLLLRRKVDVILENDLVMEQQLAGRAGADSIQQYPFKNKELGVYFSNDFLKDNPAFKQRFESALAKCEQG